MGGTGGNLQDEEVNSFWEELWKQKKQMKALESQLAASKEEVLRYQKQLEDKEEMKEKVEDRENEENKEEEEVEKLKKEVRSLKLKLSNQNRMNNEKDETIIDLKKQLEDAEAVRKEKMKLQMSMSNSNRQMKEMEQQLKKLQAKYMKLVGDRACDDEEERGGVKVFNLKPVDDRVEAVEDDRKCKLLLGYEGNYLKKIVVISDEATFLTDESPKIVFKSSDDEARTALEAHDEDEVEEEDNAYREVLEKEMEAAVEAYASNGRSEKKLEKQVQQINENIFSLKYRFEDGSTCSMLGERTEGHLKLFDARCNVKTVRDVTKNEKYIITCEGERAAASRIVVRYRKGHRGEDVVEDALPLCSLRTGTVTGGGEQTDERYGNLLVLHEDDLYFVSTKGLQVVHLQDEVLRGRDVEADGWKECEDNNKTIMIVQMDDEMLLMTKKYGMMSMCMKTKRLLWEEMVGYDESVTCIGTRGCDVVVGSRYKGGGERDARVMLRWFKKKMGGVVLVASEECRNVEGYVRGVVVDDAGVDRMVVTCRSSSLATFSTTLMRMPLRFTTGTPSRSPPHVTHGSPPPSNSSRH